VSVLKKKLIDWRPRTPTNEIKSLEDPGLSYNYNQLRQEREIPLRNGASFISQHGYHDSETCNALSSGNQPNNCANDVSPPTQNLGPFKDFPGGLIPLLTPDRQFLQFEQSYPTVSGSFGSKGDVPNPASFMQPGLSFQNSLQMPYLVVPTLPNFVFPNPAPQRTPCPWITCSETFVRATDVNRHIEAVHLGIKHHCIWIGCSNNRGNGYCRLEKLKSHQRQKHGFVWDGLNWVWGSTETFTWKGPSA